MPTGCAYCFLALTGSDCRNTKKIYIYKEGFADLPHADLMELEIA